MEIQRRIVVKNLKHMQKLIGVSVGSEAERDLCHWEKEDARWLITDVLFGCISVNHLRLVASSVEIGNKAESGALCS